MAKEAHENAVDHGLGIGPLARTMGLVEKALDIAAVPSKDADNGIPPAPIPPDLTRRQKFVSYNLANGADGIRSLGILAVRIALAFLIVCIAIGILRG